MIILTIIESVPLDERIEAEEERQEVKLGLKDRLKYIASKHLIY